MLHGRLDSYAARSGAGRQPAARSLLGTLDARKAKHGLQPSASAPDSPADAADDALLAELVQAAARAPVVAVPWPLPQLPPQQQQQHAAAAPGSSSSHAHQQQPQQQRIPLPGRKLRPSRMDFTAMLQRLAAWRARHLSAHVPRHCFDAPELGAWVRYMRKQHKEGRLEQWKADRCGGGRRSVVCARATSSSSTCDVCERCWLYARAFLQWCITSAACMHARVHTHACISVAVAVSTVSLTTLSLAAPALQAGHAWL